MAASPQRWVLSGQSERIAAANFDDYPSRELLETAHTPDQQAWWAEIHSWHQAIRDCWLVRIAVKQQANPSRFDPLLPLLDAKQIDQLHYDLVWSQVDEADSWFSLIAACLAELNADVSQRGHDPCTAYHWFVSMRQAAADNLYRVCLEGYVEISKADVKQSADFLRHLENHNEKARKSYERWVQHHHPLDALQTPDIPFILGIAEVKADKDPEVRKYLNAYKQAKAKTADIMATMLRRTRDSKAFERPRAMAWYKGQAQYGQKHGGTYG